MVRLAANLSMLFTEYPFAERFAHAAAAGFKAVEVQFPYELPAQQIAETLSEHNLELILFNVPAGDWAAGDRGIAVDPGRVGEFHDGVSLAVDYARVLQPNAVNILAGITADPEGTRELLLNNLRYAADALGQAGSPALIEPVNTYDVPEFAIPTAAAGLNLIERADAPNLALQLDVYHAVRAGEDVDDVIRSNIQHIAHIQIADAPGRHQPGTGQIDFPRLFRTLDELDYTGWVALEYIPEGKTNESFEYVRSLGLV